jgi:hypothetical protein
MAWEANDHNASGDDADRLGRFIENVRNLWPRYKTSDDEIKERIWPRFRRVDRKALGEIIVQHGREYPDAIGPNWTIIRRMVGDGASSNLNPLELLIMQYRKDADRQMRQWCADKSDPEVWQRHVEAQVYPCMFGVGGRFKQDMDHALRMGRMTARRCAESMARDIEEAGAEVPDWLTDVGIPERWLRALEIHKQKASA